MPAGSGIPAEACDPELSATALRGLAVQCVDLGYRAEAVQLGEACVDYGRNLDSPRAVACYEATLANAAEEHLHHALDMRVRLRRYSGSPEAQELRERAARVAG
ncbi:hypothetical protein [Streptomyces sp. NBC_00096]|uniref:hypothetical protein n=1 Tax=Streptomyces sp. NBC_00096 TaxID=2975650 RepID=UPI003243B034